MLPSLEMLDYPERRWLTELAGVLCRAVLKD